MHSIAPKPVRTIHPDDHMFSFMRDHLKLPHDEAIHDYLLHGRETTELFCRLMVENGLAGRDISVLEFASGYGCVTRFLIEKCPNARVTCCDIHPSAVAFLQSQFGVDAVLSDSVPERLTIERRFDVVFVVSLFSHLPKATWTRWLRSISRFVKRDGLLIFSTHGMTSTQHFPGAEIGEDGYWFHPVSEQNDIDPQEYGSTITTEEFVRKQIGTIPGLRLLSFQPGALRRNQDIYVLRRVPLWRAVLNRIGYGTS